MMRYTVSWTIWLWSTLHIWAASTDADRPALPLSGPLPHLASLGCLCICTRMCKQSGERNSAMSADHQPATVTSAYAEAGMNQRQ